MRLFGPRKKTRYERREKNIRAGWLVTMFIQVGQCGNQLSEEVWTLARRELEYDTRPFPYHPWFAEECSWSFSKLSGRSISDNNFCQRQSILYPRAIAIDTEPNVVRNGTAATGFRPENVVLGGSGGGGGCSNCWAAGFTEQGDLLERSLETVRRESERCHVQRGMTIVNSLGGGTGSGMGSALLSLLRDDYPSICLTNLAVSPFLHESPLQTYNCCLSLAYLAQFSDGVMLRSNSETLRSRLQLLSSSGGRNREGGQSNAHRVTLGNLNEMLAIDFCTMALPTALSHSLNSMGFFISSVSPLPLIKFCDVQSTCSMSPLLPSMKQQHQKETAVNRRLSVRGEGVRWPDLVAPLVRRKGVGYDRAVNIATHILLRGATKEEIDEQNPSSAIRVLRRTLGKGGYGDGLVDISFAPMLYHLQTGKCTSAAAMCCNSTGIADWIHETLKRGRGLLSSRAYCHYYNSKGVEDEDFEAAFEVLESTIDTYDAWQDS